MFDPYDPTLGCLAVGRGDRWYVVAPDGAVIADTDQDEYEARMIAQYHNLTREEQDGLLWQRAGVHGR